MNGRIAQLVIALAIVALIAIVAAISVAAVVGGIGHLYSGFEIASMTGVALVGAGLVVLGIGAIGTQRTGQSGGLKAYVEREQSDRTLRAAATYSLILVVLGAILVLGSPFLESGANSPTPSGSPEATSSGDETPAASTSAP